jgi:hypothetical protein
MNPLPLFDSLPWRRDLPSTYIDVILLRAGPGEMPEIATWADSDGWEGGGYYETWTAVVLPSGRCVADATGRLPRAEIASAGWEWMAVGVVP